MKSYFEIYFTLLKIWILKLRMFNFKSFLRDKLDIPSYQEMREIHKEIEHLKQQNRGLELQLQETEYTNSFIKRHLKLLNDEFVVTADIGSPYNDRDPSIVMIIPKHGQKMVKTYHFRGDALDEIYRIIEGFGSRVQIDSPRGIKFPPFRF